MPMTATIENQYYIDFDLIESVKLVNFLKIFIIYQTHCNIFTCLSYE
jgi:hypothetical protein